MAAHKKTNRWRARDKALGTFVGTLSLAAVVVVAWWESEERISPGDLHASHSGVTELQGKGGCVACHGIKGGTMDKACEVCHIEIQDQRANDIGLHGRLEQARLRECNECHTEHTGGLVALVGTESFVKAGAASNPFDHTRVADFALAGAHAQLQCRACHLQAEKPALADGDVRYLGLSQDCGSCHDDIHKGSFGTDCASCHGQEQPFVTVAAFDHTSVFPLLGGHAGLNCSECHQPDGASSVAILLSAENPDARACGACHESPHRPEFIAAIAKDRGIPESTSCAVCHNAEHQTFRGPAATVSKAQHAATGFALIPPHDNVECVACHKNGNREKSTAETYLSAQFAALYPGRSQSECQQCHNDPHNGDFTPGFSKGECARCHEFTRFVPSRVDASLHSMTRFPLTGAHQAIACDRCHDRGRGIDRFIPTATECRMCHEDIHRGRFDSENGKTSDCARCHDTVRFDSVRWSATDHLLWTGYALEGAHGKASCVGCHEAGKPYAEKFASTKTECASCHEDVHRGAFAASIENLPAGDRKGCALCHNTTTFGDVVWTQEDHATWTGYALEGKHEQVDCAKCHPALTDTGIVGRRFGVASSACASCHEDIHVGQFDANGRTDCSRCHTFNDPFRMTAFNHQTDSRFPLDGQHIRLDCGVCHESFQLANGRTAIRYKPLGARCQDCHNFSGTAGVISQ